MKRNQTIVKEINSMLPPTNPKYPVCFERDNMVVVSGEVYINETINGEVFDGVSAIDYYGELNKGYPFICNKLEDYAKKNNGYWEWESPACVVFIRN